MDLSDTTFFDITLVDIFGRFQSFIWRYKCQLLSYLLAQGSPLATLEMCT